MPARWETDRAPGNPPLILAPAQPLGCAGIGIFSRRQERSGICLQKERKARFDTLYGQIMRLFLLVLLPAMALEIGRAHV